MKKLATLSALFLALTGCQTMEKITNDAISGAINGAVGSATGAIGGATGDNYSVEGEDIYITEAKKTARPLGAISEIKTENNPDGRTMVVIDNCNQPLVGNVACLTYFYEMTMEGWLDEDGIRIGNLNKMGTLSAGRYYYKTQSENTKKRYWSTGVVTIQPHVTNRISLRLE